jgi:hypothetical protein
VIITTGLAVAGLGLVFAGIGLDRADQLASVIGALAAIAGLGLSLAFWLAGRAHVRSAAPDAQGSGRFTVDARRAKGVQIGEGNSQTNTFR